MCQVRDMLCHAHVSKPKNRKVYWNLSCVCVKSMCSEPLKVRSACNKNVFWSDLCV